jgi:UDP-galactopyranose mutase
VDDIPYYPIRLIEEKALLGEYIARAATEKNVTFVGRLGTYRYLDMDVTIREAMTTADVFLQHASTGTQPPAFAVEPM